MTITQKVITRARARGLTVRTRREWGSKHAALYQLRRVVKRAKQPADTVVLHISVTHPPGAGGKTLSDAMRELERIGMERFGSGVSYNFGIGLNGEGHVGVGQPLDAKGTHTVNKRNAKGFSYDQNYAARAICFIGMPGQQLSKDARRACVQLLVAMVLEGAITPGFDLVPHSLFAVKDCPTDTVRDAIATIRREVDLELEGLKRR